MSGFSFERFRQAVLVQYEHSLDKSDRAAAQRYISAVTESEVSPLSFFLRRPYRFRSLHSFFCYVVVSNVPLVPVCPVLLP